jgi:hypothetical protein
MKNNTGKRKKKPVFVEKLHFPFIKINKCIKYDYNNNVQKFARDLTNIPF